MDITTLAAANAYTNKKVAEGGMPVVELTTILKDGTDLTEAESLAVQNEFDKGKPFAIAMQIHPDVFGVYNPAVLMFGLRMNIGESNEPEDRDLQLMSSMGPITFTFSRQGLNPWSFSVINLLG